MQLEESQLYYNQAAILVGLIGEGPRKKLGEALGTPAHGSAIHTYSKLTDHPVSPIQPVPSQ